MKKRFGLLTSRADPLALISTQAPQPIEFMAHRALRYGPTYTIDRGSHVKDQALIEKKLITRKTLSEKELLLRLAFPSPCQKVLERRKLKVRENLIEVVRHIPCAFRTAQQKTNGYLLEKSLRLVIRHRVVDCL